MLVHTCFAQKAGDPKPACCLCRKRITHEDAIGEIARGEAEWLKTFSSVTGMRLSTTAVVRFRNSHTPKSATIDARHIQHAYVDLDEQAAIRIEEYGLLTLALRAEWMVTYRADPNEGQ